MIQTKLKKLARGKGKRAKKLGLPPGTLVATSDKSTGNTVITVIDYDTESLQEKVVENVTDCYCFKDTSTVTWINVEGVHDTDVVQKLGTHFDLHPLTMEDILNTDQRPKFENMGHYLYIVARMIYFIGDSHEITSEQVSIIVGSNFVITFQEQDQNGDVFDFVRGRIRSSRGRLRRLGSDYLAYALLDAIVDYYFVILEELGEDIEMMEKKLISDPRSEILTELYGYKRSMLSLRRSVWPMREVINGMQREETLLLDQSTMLYLQDVYGHTVQIIDTIEILRETLGSMLEIYLSSVSYKLNSVMKVLTIVATIFMPLTFISSIYGMNFKFMPELEWQYGYPFSLALMGSVALVMLVYFRVRKWV